MVYDNSFSLPLPQLLDLALGSPENGAVNFNILHSLLHIMIQQMELSTTRAEFINGDVERMDRLTRRAPKEPYLKLEEYIVCRGRESKEEREAAEFSAAQLGLIAKGDKVYIHREPDSTKETVVVVMPHKYEPSDEPEVQYMRVSETRVSNTYEKGVVMSSKRPMSKPLDDGRRPPTRPGPGGDIVRRKKPGTPESAVGPYLETGPPAPTQAGPYPPPTAYLPDASYPASPYAVPTTPYPAVPYPAVPYPAPTSLHAISPYPAIAPYPVPSHYPEASPYAQNSYSSPAYDYTEPPSSYLDTTQYSYPPYWYPVTGVRPEDLFPGSPEYPTIYYTPEPQNPEEVERVVDGAAGQSCLCDPRYRKHTAEEKSPGRRGETQSRPLAEGAPVGQGGDNAPAAPGPRTTMTLGPQQRDSISSSLPVKPTLVTPGYRGAMMKISEESLPLVPWAGGMAIPGTLPGDEDSIGGLQLVPPLSGGAGVGVGAGARDSASRETLSRLDVVETDIRQLWKILEENRFLGPPLVDEVCDELRDNLGNLEKRMWEYDCRLANTDATLESMLKSLTPDGKSLIDVRERPPETLTTEIHQRIEESSVVKSLRADIEDIKRNCLENEEHLAMESEKKPVDSPCRCVKEVKNIKKSLEALTGGDFDFSQIEPGSSFLPLDSGKFKSLEERLNVIDDQIVKQNSMIQNLTERIDNMYEQSSDMEREIGLIAEKFLHEGKANEKALGLTQNTAGLEEVLSMIHLLQCNMEDVSNTCAKLMQERDERAHHMLSLETQLKALVQIKADRDELDEALLSKADNVEVNRKVSHDQFDSALEDLTKGLQDAMAKLSQQEMMWQQALDELQHEVGNKLDSEELAPLKEIMNKKLKNLNERLRNLAKVRKQAEAAGTKKKLLKDVTCISCDVGAVMRTELDGNVPICPPLPSNQSMKPYLTYELDMIRKERKSAQGKHLIHLEGALTDQKHKQTAEEGQQMFVMKQDHLCNRYCGGSHTLTSAYQRVIRMGHFVSKEVGPECLQLLPEKAPADPMLGRTLPDQGKMENDDTKKLEKNALPLPKTERKSANQIQ